MLLLTTNKQEIVMQRPPLSYIIIYYFYTHILTINTYARDTVKDQGGFYYDA